MISIKERIFRYPDLSSAEQAKLEEAIRSHPDQESLRSLLAEVKALDQRLHHLELPPESEAPHPLPNALLALYVVRTEHELLDTWSPAMQQAFAEVEAHLEHNSDLRTRVAKMRKRFSETETSVDPVRHFEAISDHDTGTAPAVSPSGSSSTTNGSTEPGLVDRIAKIPQYVTYSLAGAGAMLILYGVLFVISLMMQSPTERMAALDSEQMNVEGYEITTRSVEAVPQSNDETFLLALETLERSYVTTLGLFPRFDEAKLTTAQEHFEALVDSEPSGSFLQLEARFFLGKTYLAQGEVEAARDAFRYVVIGEGARADEASALLEEIQTHYPMEVPESLPDDVQL